MKVYNLTAQGTIESEASLSPFISKHDGNLVVEIVSKDFSALSHVKLAISAEETLLLIANLANALLTLKSTGAAPAVAIK